MSPLFSYFFLLLSLLFFTFFFYLLFSPPSGKSDNVALVSAVAGQVQSCGLDVWYERERGSEGASEGRREGGKVGAMRRGSECK